MFIQIIIPRKSFTSRGGGGIYILTLWVDSLGPAIDSLFVQMLIYSSLNNRNLHIKANINRTLHTNVNSVWEWLVI